MRTPSVPDTVPPDGRIHKCVQAYFLGGNAGELDGAGVDPESDGLRAGR